MIRFQCPSCGNLSQQGDDKAGKKYQCQNCGTAFLIPEKKDSLQPISSKLFYSTVLVAVMILAASLGALLKAYSGNKPRQVAINTPVVTPATPETVTPEPPKPPVTPEKPPVTPEKPPVTPAVETPSKPEPATPVVTPPEPVKPPTPEKLPVTPTPVEPPKPAPVKPKPTPPKVVDIAVSDEPILDWNFHYVASGGKQGKQVNNNQKMAAGDIFNATAVTIPSDPAMKSATLIFKTPVYVTYDPKAEGASKRPGMDGFAIATLEGHPLLNPSNGSLGRATCTSGSFSVWVRAKRVMHTKAKMEAVLKRNGQWIFGISENKVTLNFGGAIKVFDQFYMVNTWRDLGLIFNSQEKSASVFVDGVLAGTVAVTRVPDRSAAFEVGSGPGGSDPFDGWIDRVVYWNRVVDDQTMRELSGK